MKFDRKKPMILVALLLLAAVSVSCGKKAAETAEASPEETGLPGYPAFAFTYGSYEEGIAVRDDGKELMIHLQGRPSAGYSWQVVPEDPGLVEMSEESKYPMNNGDESAAESETAPPFDPNKGGSGGKSGQGVYSMVGGGYGGTGGGPSPKVLFFRAYGQTGSKDAVPKETSIKLYLLMSGDKPEDAEAPTREIYVRVTGDKIEYLGERSEKAKYFN